MAEQPLQTVPHFTDATLDEIDQIVQTHGPALLKAGKGLRESIALSHAIQRMRAIVSLALVESDIMGLMNTSLGFKTDRPDKRKKLPAYTPEEVRDPLIEAVLRGARVTGNEFNVLFGGCYLTKEYFVRKVMEFPGVSNVIPTPGVAQKVGEDGALVPFTVRWLLNGEEMVEERVEHGKRGEPGYRDERIPVKVNFGMGADAIIGKASRKIFAAVYARLTGATSPLPDGDVDDLAGDSSRQPRDHATVDLGAFKASKEPNRGHGDTDMDQVTKPAEPEPEPAPEPEKRQAESPAAQYLTCEHCGLHFGSAGHLDSHLKITHSETQVKPSRVGEMRTELRTIVTEVAGLTGKDMRQVTSQERETVWGIFDALTDGQARATNDVPEAMLPDVLAQARTMLEDQMPATDAGDETFEA